MLIDSVKKALDNLSSKELLALKREIELKLNEQNSEKALALVSEDELSFINSLFRSPKVECSYLNHDV